MFSGVKKGMYRVVLGILGFSRVYYPEREESNEQESETGNGTWDCRVDVYFFSSLARSTQGEQDPTTYDISMYV